MKVTKLSMPTRFVSMLQKGDIIKISGVGYYKIIDITNSYRGTSCGIVEVGIIEYLKSKILKNIRGKMTEIGKKKLQWFFIGFTVGAIVEYGVMLYACS